MNVTNVTVITTAEEKTANASYILEYTVTGGTLIRAQANIMESSVAKSGIQQSVGMIYLEQDIVSCTMPKDRDLAPYFTDFDTFLKTIRETISNPSNN